MSAPVLSRKLVLEGPNRVADGAGGYSETWEVLGTLWGELSARSGREVPGEAGSVAAGSYRITVRAVPEGQSMRPKAGQRFWSGSRVFRVLAVTERDPEARYLVCFAQEEVAV